MRGGGALVFDQHVPGSTFHVSGVWEAPQCADSGEPLIERPLHRRCRTAVRRFRPNAPLHYSTTALQHELAKRTHLNSELTTALGPCSLADNHVSPLTGPFYEEKSP